MILGFLNMLTYRIFNHMFTSPNVNPHYMVNNLVDNFLENVDVPRS